MHLKINKKNFTKNILQSIGNISEKACLSFSSEGLESVVSNSENNIILYLQAPQYKSEHVEANIGDVKRLIRALDCIEQEDIILQVEPGFILYETDHFKFKYHTLQPGILQRHTIDTNKIKNLKAHTSFSISNQAFNKILTGTSFASDTNKIYFYTRDKQVYANLTDYTTPYADLIGFNVSEGFSGESLKVEIPLNIDSLKLINYQSTCTMRVDINTELNIVIFNVTSEFHTTKYILSALVK